MKHTLYLLSALLMLSACKQKQETPETFLSQNKVEAKSVRQPAEEKENSLPDLLKQRVPRGTSDIILRKKAFTVSYNKRTRTPNWVAWTLTKEHSQGHLLRDNERFEEDPNVPEPRATYQDYYNSRYDRGHMCPAGDNKWDQEALTESFLMTNICPQNHGLNKEDWNDLEMKCREWARDYGEITIVCGPIFEYEDEPRYIGKNKVMVPTSFFKIVYRTSPQPRAVGFLFENTGKRQPWRKAACSIDEIELRTGIDFFPQLPDKIENEVESLTSAKGW